MARSLQIQHEERVTTSPLLTGALVFAALWLFLGAVVAASAADEPATTTDAVTR